MKKANQEKHPPVLLSIIIIAAILAAILVTVWHSTTSYHETTQLATEQFNRQQLILARSAARGIETFIADVDDDLLALSNFPAVQQMEAGILERMEVLYRRIPPQTSSRRLDENGILRFIYPNEGWRVDLIGQDYNEEAYFQEAKESGEVVISGLVINEAGEQRILVVRPVYGEDDEGAREFTGVIIGSFDPDVLAGLYISPIVSGETGYAWLLNQDGIFLAHHEKEFVGQDAFEVRAEINPELSYEAINDIQRQIIAGEEGVSRYVSGWHREQSGEIEKLVAYVPVQAGNSLWSVVVCAPLDEVERITSAAHRNELYSLSFIILTLTAAGGFFFVAFYRWTRSLRQEIEIRTQAEEELSVAYDALASSVNGVIIVDLEGKIRYANPSFLSMFEYEDEGQVSGKRAAGLFPSEKVQRFSDVAAMIDKVKGETEEFLARRKDGTVFHVEVSSSMVTDQEGNDVGRMASFVDITERVQAQESLHRRNRELALINRVIAAASTTLELKAVLETTCRELALAFDLPQASAALLNEARTASIVVAEYLSEGRSSALDVVIPLEGNPATQYVLEHKTPLAVADVQHDPRMAAIHEVMRQRGTVTMLILPLMVRGHVVGTLGLDAVERREFSSEEIDLAAAATAAAAQALENARLFDDAERRLERLASLRSIDQAITGVVDLSLSLDIVLGEVATQLAVDAVDVLLYDPHLQSLRFAGGKGFETQALQHTTLRLGEGYAGKAALERRTVHIKNLTEAKNGLKKAPLLPGEGFVSYYGVPLIAKGEIKGVLELFHRSPLEPTLEWLDFLETLAGQAAIVIDNATLFNDLQRSNLELALAYDRTLEGWAQAVTLRDWETGDHTRRVTEMTLRLARALGIGAEKLVHVRRGAVLHDIGKLGIPDHILLKPGPLDDEEWEIMRQHPTYARDLLFPIDYLRPALDIPYSHHEKWDGSGYPQGLRGEQIPLAARIFAIVDVWDALNSNRPYREAWPEEKALAYIREQSGKYFDPKVVEAFLELVDQKTRDQETRN